MKQFFEIPKGTEENGIYSSNFAGHLLDVALGYMWKLVAAPINHQSITAKVSIQSQPTPAHRYLFTQPPSLETKCCTH